MKLSFSTAFLTLILTATLSVSGCRSPSADERQVPPSNVAAASSRVWAVRIEKPGLPNLRRVSDDLYCGAQPTAEGFRELQAMGVKTVIDLRSFHNDRKKIAGTDLAYEEIPMNAWHPEDEDVVRFLILVADRSRAPFFVHCKYGADRAGMMCAVYRIVIQGWTKDEAIAEMTQGGFGFHAIWENLVDYLRKLDVEELKRQAFHSRAQEISIFGPAQAKMELKSEILKVETLSQRVVGTETADTMTEDQLVARARDICGSADE
jgi:protein tyrosine phosphatase (PTP) superfamily phosphohydrolase (DUF442 family)